MWHHGKMAAVLRTKCCYSVRASIGVVWVCSGWCSLIINVIQWYKIFAFHKLKHCIIFEHHLACKGYIQYIVNFLVQ